MIIKGHVHAKARHNEMVQIASLFGSWHIRAGIWQCSLTVYKGRIVCGTVYKVFWKMFKKKAPDKSCNATSKDLFKHFQNLAAQNEYVGENNSNVHDRSYNEGENREDRRSTFEELDVKITIDEIVKSCNRLRSDKAPSLDNILYKYFKNKS